METRKGMQVLRIRRVRQTGRHGTIEEGSVNHAFRTRSPGSKTRGARQTPGMQKKVRTWTDKKEEECATVAKC